MFYAFVQHRGLYRVIKYWVNAKHCSLFFCQAAKGCGILLLAGHQPKLGNMWLFPVQITSDTSLIIMRVSWNRHQKPLMNFKALSNSCNSWRKVQCLLSFCQPQSWAVMGCHIAVKLKVLRHFSVWSCSEANLKLPHTHWSSFFDITLLKAKWWAWENDNSKISP